MVSLSDVKLSLCFPLLHMIFSPSADFQTCSYQGGTVWLHYSLLQLSVHAEAEDQHFAVCLQQGEPLLVFSSDYVVGQEYADSRTLCLVCFHSLPLHHLSHTCLAAHTSSPTLLGVSLLAITSTSRPWRAHTSSPMAFSRPRRWLQDPGEFLRNISWAKLKAFGGF